MTDAYVAGLVDGEGCVSISHDKRTDYYSPRVDIGMTLRAKPILEQIHAQHGGTLRKTRDATEKWEEAWAWLVVSRRAATFLERIQPILSLKQEQARLCLCLQRMVDALPRQANGNAHWNSDARSKAHSLQIQIQNLNRKGPQQETVPDWFARVVGDHLLTPQADMFSDLGFSEFSETLPDSGWFADGFLYALRTSGPAISGSGCSLWPTALQENGESCGNHPGAVDSLTGAAKLWNTPRAITGGAETAERKQELGRTESGGGDLQAQTQLWQTPATDSFRSRGGDRKDEMGLDQQARMYFVQHHCPSPPAPAIPDGLASSEPAPTSRRRLNPRFVEWLMGFPVTWTEP
jgi:hypothetical protein